MKFTFKPCKHDWKRAWMHAAELMDNHQLHDLDVPYNGRLLVVKNGRQLFLCSKCGKEAFGDLVKTYL